MDNKKYSGVCSFLFPVLFSLAVPAQAVDLGAEAQKPAEAITQGGEAALAAEQARAAAADEGEDVNFSDVMANPDDPALNYKYARTQVRRGDLKGAAATLERMLMINPALDDIRLFHAAVLYRMDDLGESKAELETLKGASLPPALRAEADNYLKMIARRSRLLTASGSFTVGASYDSNRNSAPASDEVMALGSVFPLTGLNKRRGDASLITAANAELKRPFAANSKNELFLSGVYYRADQRNLTDISLGALSAAAGVRLRSPRTTLTPKLVYDNVYLDNSSFLQNAGASLRLDRRLSWNYSAYAEARFLDQKFIVTPEAAANWQRTGSQQYYALGLSRIFGPSSQLEAEVSVGAKDARKGYYAYDTLGASLRHSWLLSRGMFLLTSAQLSRDAYRRADALVDPGTRRRDTIMKGSLTLGLPGSLAAKSLKNLTVTLGYEHLRDSSNITNYTYNSDKGTLLFNYKWEAGIW